MTFELEDAARDILKAEIYELIEQLMIKLKSLDTRAAKKLKRFLSGMTIHGFK